MTYSLGWIFDKRKQVPTSILFTPVRHQGHSCEQVSKYNYITVHLKASWAGLICHTHQHYHRQ